MLAAWRPALAQPSVAFQINAQHTGGTIFPSGFKLPLRLVWTRSYPTPFGEINQVSFPIIVDGRVYFTLTEPRRAIPTRIVALSLATGRELWTKPLNTSPIGAGLGYDNGRLFAVTSEGMLVALNARSGAVLWQNQLEDESSWSFGAPPTAHDGLLFLTGGGDEGTAFAIRQWDGKIVWKRRIANGGGSPTLAPQGLVIGSTCQVHMLNPQTGAVRWKFDMTPACTGGHGDTAPYHQGLLFPNHVAVEPTLLVAFDARTGGTLFAFQDIIRPPAFHAGIGYFTTKFNGLIAWSIDRKRVLWKRYGAFEPTLPPLVVNGRVITMTQNFAQSILHVLDGQTGAILQEVPLPTRLSDNCEGCSTIRKGNAAGEGVLIVTTDSTLYAFKPSPN